MDTMDTNSSEDAAGELVRTPVCEEQLQLGRRTVDTGRGVRLHKTVHEVPHPVAAELWHDALEVRRVPIERVVAMSEAPQTREEGDTLIVPVLEEILVLEKRVRIKEEIHITRTRHPKPYAETVVLRAEQVSVEHFDDTGPSVSR